MNVLWIMADQLRWDYLSCYGATHISTPNIDRLASKGVRFDRAYVQSPICGPSRMSFYTGRYVRSHGATWNGFPLRVGEPRLGDHLREVGVTSTLVGKTHMRPDEEGMKRLGIDPESTIGALVSQCGFDEYVRDDGTNAANDKNRHAEDYERYLREHGMDGETPWEEWANTAIGPDGKKKSGWFLENAPLAARVPKEHSETSWLTTRGIEFIESQGDDPWLCHLSYIKPHWPYLAPAPYNDMYSKDDLPPVNRRDDEHSHPLMQAWEKTRICDTFSREDVREVVAPVYMGLIKELDDNMGRLLDYLETSGRMKDTMVVFCSDHGDNMGDHWLGEKDLFFDCSARIPLIVYDPRDNADSTRGTSTDKLIEGIDLAPTFHEFLGGEAKPHVMEGRSLAPLLHGDKGAVWRDHCISEYDYSTRDARQEFNVDESDARLVMVFDGRWKYVHVELMRPMLFDLETDPDELYDLGECPEHQDQIERLRELHFAWARKHHSRITRSPQIVERMAAGKEPPGIYIAHWSREDAEANGLPPPPHLDQ